ncbi:MAG: holo-ACP synthase [Defluviitaleaceae bacterium]|nr:holo-ACP synthase [Defluviitaleaceae bacterium]
MILGVGTDIVEVSRMAKAIASQAFVGKCFTKSEIERCNAMKNAAASFAGCFAAKESVVKALGTGFRGFFPRDVEIFHDAMGRPHVRLAPSVDVPEGTQISISISHEREYATAVAVIWTV